MKPLVVFVAGPTASGKTALAVSLAQKLQGEVISADSMQIYKEMDIGSAKPTLEETAGIPHHMLDIVSPFAGYTAAQFQEQANTLIQEIIARGRLPIVAGGTGLYIHGLLYEMDFSGAQSDPAYRQMLQNLLEKQGGEALYRLLQEKDGTAAAQLHPNDTKRIMRALEVFQCTGISKDKRAQSWQKPREDFISCLIGLTLERGRLYEKINARVEDMFARGLVEEVQKLRSMGLTPAHQSMQGIGYKEILRALSGEYTLEEAKEKIQQESRRYAKRQLTWFRREAGIQWIDRTDKTEAQVLQEALLLIEKCKEGQNG